MKRTWLVGALVLQVIAVSVPSASAQTSVGGDIVITATGGRLRGTVSEYEPDVRVTIILPDGTTRTLGAGEFSSVTFADTAPAVAPVPPPTPIEPVAPSPTQIVVPHAAEARPSVERWTERRAYGGSVATPWLNAAHELSVRRPRGDLHFGIQVEGGFMLAMKDFFQTMSVLPVGGAFAFLDVRAGETGTVRVGALFDVAAAGDISGFDYHTYERVTVATFRTVGIGARLLGGHDLTDSLTLRAGIEVQAVLAGESFGFEGDARIELAGRLLDSRNLEIGGAITLGTTPNMRFFYELGGGRRESGHVQGLSFPGVTLFAAWVFE